MTIDVGSTESSAAHADGNIEAAQAIAAAIAQISLAVRDVQPPVEQLGLLIGNMSQALGELRAAHIRNRNPDRVAEFPDEVDKTIARLETEVRAGITQLQFYDRMAQHVGHVHDYLSAVANLLAVGSAATVDNEAIWAELAAKLRVRLISAAQRQLFDMILRPSDTNISMSRQARDEYASQGTVELF
jgi:hypothetical protein